MRHSRSGRKTGWQVNMLWPNGLAWFLTSLRQPLPLPNSTSVQGRQSKPRWHLWLATETWGQVMFVAVTDRSAKVPGCNEVACALLWMRMSARNVGALRTVVNLHWGNTFFTSYGFKCDVSGIPHAVMHMMDMNDQAQGVFVLECHPVGWKPMGSGTLQWRYGFFPLLP